MLNKKAIAAFAAGATLLSGMAFAAPAFAAEPAKDPKAEKCATAQNNVTKLEQEKAVLEAKVTVAKSEYDAAQALFDNAKTLAGQYKAAVNAYKAAAKKAEDAKAADEDHGALDDAAEHARKSLADVVTKVKADKKLTAAAAFDASDATKAKTLKADALDATVNADTFAASKDELNQAKYNVFLKDADLTAAKADLAKLACQASGSEQNPPKHDPTTPTQPGSVKDADAAKADVMVKAAAYDAARVKNAAAKADAQKAYEEAAKAKKADEAAQAEVDAAQKAVDLFAGDKTSKEYKDLNDRLDRAKAKKTFTENTFKAAAAKYAEKQAAFDAANAEAQKAYDAYKAAVNVAAAFGVDVTKLPVVVAMDPLDKTFPGFADAQQLYRDAQSGKFGPAAAAAAKGAAAAAAADKKADKQGKITVEKGKDKAGKNLPKTGAAIALTALAASVLAGMGAAVRKVRH
ncbi:hypothetical protein [Gardnerella sp. 2492-Sm]|uniref:hypothetical protein n=1 Tax=unclassified Gardnerella TaxID=2628112 RepID=UPI003D08FB69